MKSLRMSICLYFIKVVEVYSNKDNLLPMIYTDITYLLKENGAW